MRYFTAHIFIFIDRDGSCFGDAIPRKKKYILQGKKRLQMFWNNCNTNKMKKEIAIISKHI